MATSTGEITQTGVFPKLCEAAQRTDVLWGVCGEYCGEHCGVRCGVRVTPSHGAEAVAWRPASACLNT